MSLIQYAYPEWKNKAVTLSYDDGRSTDRRLVKILNDNGLKGTFHLNSGKLGWQRDEIPYISKEEVATLYQGHEVASHTCDHPSLDLLPKENVVQQIMTDRSSLEKFVGYPVRGFSYPYGKYNDEVISLLKETGIRYARTTKSTQCFDLPENPYTWDSTCHHNQHLLERTDEFLSFKRNTVLTLFYVWGHSYEFEQQQNWDLIEKFAEKISGQPDIWYATNIEIINYLDALKQLRFAADLSFVENPTNVTIYLSYDGEHKVVESGKITKFLK